jgi:glycine/D-amino acid oxidase-like deaminating enzyme
MAADITIVGQGICGSLLSWSLLQRGVSVVVYDRGIEGSATYAASGIINPITGKRFVKSWMIDELIPVSERTYKTLGQKLSENLYRSLPIYKLPQSVKEQNDWSARTGDQDYAMYLSNTELQTLDSDEDQKSIWRFHHQRRWQG